MNRRNIIRRPLFGVATLAAGCTAFTSPNSTVPAQIVADVNGVVKFLSDGLPTIFALLPSGSLSATDQTQILTSINTANALVGGFVAGMPTSAAVSLAQKIEGYVNDTVNLVGPILNRIATDNPNLSSKLAPWIAGFDSAAALLPGIEAWINGTFSVPVSPSVRSRYTPRVRMDASTARKQLHIPTVGG